MSNRSQTFVSCLKFASEKSKMSQKQTYVDTCKLLSKSLVSASNGLPTQSADFSYLSSFDSVRKMVDLLKGKNLTALNKFYSANGIKYERMMSVSEMEQQDFVDVVIDGNDQFTDSITELITSKNNHSDKPNDEYVIVSRTENRSDGTPQKVVNLFTSSKITRPQLSFTRKVDNSNTIFIPFLKEKPHAIVSLQDSLVTSKTIDLSVLESHPHPYEKEIRQHDIAPWQLRTRKLNKPVHVDDMEPVFINDIASLNKFMNEMVGVQEIAVDLEHHDYRSFMGFVCLIQISTRDKDYIIDPFPLRDDLTRLNEIFADPAIMKVFFGAESDIVWLQKEFSVYIVNMFDARFAASALGFQKTGLSACTEKYCGYVNAKKKKFQLADWRIRPLPQMLMKYAQSDSHYLLHIADCLHNDVLAEGGVNMLKQVYAQSRELCLLRYERPLIHADSYVMAFKKQIRALNKQQVEALRLLHAWRDTTGREEDEGIGYILPNHMLLSLATHLPKEPAGIMACCTPCPPLVRRNLMEIRGLIMKARSLAEFGTDAVAVAATKTPETPNASENAKKDASFSHPRLARFLKHEPPNSLANSYLNPEKCPLATPTFENIPNAKVSVVSYTKRKLLGNDAGFLKEFLSRHTDLLALKNAQHVAIAQALDEVETNAKRTMKTEPVPTNSESIPEKEEDNDEDDDCELVSVYHTPAGDVARKSMAKKMRLHKISMDEQKQAGEDVTPFDYAAAKLPTVQRSRMENLHAKKIEKHHHGNSSSNASRGRGGGSWRARGMSKRGGGSERNKKPFGDRF